MDKYQKVEKLGEGSYGIVYKARHKLSNIIVALKRIRLDCEDQGIPAAAIREISLLKEFRHPNIVRLHDVIYGEKKLTLVFEYLDSDLRKFIDNYPEQLNLGLIKKLMVQLLEGVAYCHERKVFHRDLKPQNLLIDRKFHLKIGDFGLARTFELPVKKYSDKVVTLWYRPPDVLMGLPYSTASIDLWSVGCIFGEMALGRPVFPGNSDKEQLVTIFKVLGTPDETVWSDLKQLTKFKIENYEKYEGTPLQEVFPKLDGAGVDLMKNLIQYEPSKRISAENALKHWFFTGFR